MATKKAGELRPAHRQILEQFAILPDSALVPVQVVAAHESVSVNTVWRWVRQGVLPAPKKIAGSTRWTVGVLRNRAG